MENRIRELREQRRMKQRELAEKLGVSQNTLSTWETGRYEPDAEMLMKIASELNVSVDYLLGGDPPWADQRGDQIDPLRMIKLMRSVDQLTVNQFDQLLVFCKDLMLGVDKTYSTTGPSAVTDEDAAILRAYHALPLQIRQAVDGLLAPYAAESGEKNAV